MKYYYPYYSDKPKYKFFILTNKNKRVYFGATGYEHYTEGHLDEQRKLNYIRRHMVHENWNDIDTAGFWSYRFLWLYPTYKQAYYDIAANYL